MVEQLDIKHLPTLQLLFEDLGKEWNEGWTFNPDLTLVAVIDSKVVAFITAWDNGQPYAWIDNFLVREGCDPRIPLQLGLTMIELLRQRGVTTIRGVIDNPKLEQALIQLGWLDKGKHTIMERHYGQS